MGHSVCAHKICELRSKFIVNILSFCAVIRTVLGRSPHFVRWYDLFFWRYYLVALSSSRFKCIPTNPYDYTNNVFDVFWFIKKKKEFQKLKTVVWHKIDEPRCVCTSFYTFHSSRRHERNKSLSEKNRRLKIHCSVFNFWKYFSYNFLN